MTDLPSVSLRAADSVSGTPASLIELIRAAAGGGRATYDFFSAEASARKELAGLAAQGDQGWVLHPDAATLGHSFLTSGQPAYVLAGTKGQLLLQTELAPEVLQTDTTDYQEAGIATMWLVTDQGPVDVFVTAVEKLGPGVTAAALAPALLTLLGALRTFVTAFFRQVAAAADAGGSAEEAEAIAGDAAESAASEAEVDGEIVAEEVALSIEFGPLAIAGLVVAVLSMVLMILAFGLSKTMTAWIRVFNTAPYALPLALTYTYNLAVHQQPSTGLLPPPGTPPAPPGVTPSDQVVYRADYVLQNDNTWQGLGLVIQSPPGEGPGLTFAVDIPSVGANSLAVDADTTLPPDVYYSRMEGRCTGLTMTTPPVPDSTFSATIGTNQNSGESPSPLDGSNGYNYEYVVLVSAAD